MKKIQKEKYNKIWRVSLNSKDIEIIKKKEKCSLKD